MSDPQEARSARQGRIAALVIAGAGSLWVLAQVFGADLGITLRYMILVDLAVMAALVWALVVAYQVWQQRRAADQNTKGR